MYITKKEPDDCGWWWYFPPYGKTPRPVCVVETCYGMHVVLNDYDECTLKSHPIASFGGKWSNEPIEIPTKFKEEVE